MRRSVLLVACASFAQFTADTEAFHPVPVRSVGIGSSVGRMSKGLGGLGGTSSSLISASGVSASGVSASGVRSVQSEEVGWFQELVASGGEVLDVQEWKDESWRMGEGGFQGR
jgi:hypothetical protein